MNPDPFGDANPFGGGAEPSPRSESPPVQHADPFAATDSSNSPREGKPVAEEEDPLNFLDDDPFSSSPRRPHPAAAASATEAVTAAASAAAASPAAASAASAATTATARASDVVGAIAQAAAGAAGGGAGGGNGAAVSPPKLQTLEQWKAAAQQLAQQTASLGAGERREMAVQYAAKNGIRIEPGVLRGAETEEGLLKLCKLVRLSRSAIPYKLLTRVDIVGAQRMPGRGMEFPYWVYTFKVYTILEDYTGQPHHDGQKEEDFTVIGSVVMLKCTRRYRDFEWLRKCLVIENPGVVVPPIPEKTMQSIKEKLAKKGSDAFEGKELEGAGHDKGQWQPDEDCLRCTKCSTQFTMFVRKHHCRHCQMIFCSTCCPKPAGGERFCSDCASLKGLSEMLMKNPDVAFRMRELQLFLQECFNGPLAESETLRFFIEAPPALLADSKVSSLKKIEAAHPISVSFGDTAKEKLAHVQALFSTGHTASASELFTSMSPRGKERLQQAMRLETMIRGFKIFRDRMSSELFEGLARKRRGVPELEGPAANCAEIKALRQATIEADAALAAFSTENKEGCFVLVAQFNYLIGLLEAFGDMLLDTERASKQRKGASSNPGKLQALNDYLDEMEVCIVREERFVQSTVRTAFANCMRHLWIMERVRDPVQHNWSKLHKVATSLKDPY